MDMHELKESVFHAADDVHAAGEQPTVVGIADALGIDDVAPIVPMLQEWRIRLHLNNGAPDEPGLWAALVRSLRPLEGDFSAVSGGAGQQAALEVAQADLQADLDRVTADLTAAQSDAAALRTRLDEAESGAGDVAALEQRAVTAEAERDQAQADRDRLEVEKDALYATARAAESRADEAEAARKRVEEVDRIAASTLKAAGDAQERAEEKARQFEEELAHAKQELARFEAAEEEARSDVAETQRRLSEEGDWMIKAEDWPELPRQLALATVRIASLRAERDRLQAHLADSQAQLERSHRLLEIRLSQPTVAPTVVAAPTQAVAPAAPANAASDAGEAPRRKIEVVRRR